MKHLKKLAITLLFSAILPVFLYGQCGGEKPTWAKKAFRKSLRNSYLETVVISGTSYDEVRSKAYEIIEKWRDDATKNGRNTSVVAPSKQLYEYWECNNTLYTGYFLFQTLKNPTYQYEDVDISTDYGFSIRVLIPGMAQIHKGHTVKGLYLLGEVALGGGIIVTEALRKSNKSKIGSTHNVYDRQNYNENAGLYETTRNVLILCAAVLYAWNVIDDIAFKGKPYIKVLSDNNLRIMPYATPNAGGIQLTFNF